MPSPKLRRLAVLFALVPAIVAALALTHPPAPVAPATPVRLVSKADTVLPARTTPFHTAALSFSADRLLIPVAGVAPSDLVDTFDDARSGGRVHEAIDIMAPRGTPVVAVADGRIAQRRTNRLGGKVVYLLSPDGRYRFYYAHLNDYAPGIENGAAVYQGDTLGYVGNTGNARHTAPHLHFQVLEGSGRAVHSGRKVNPYGLLRRSRLYAGEGRVRG